MKGDTQNEESASYAVVIGLLSLVLELPGTRMRATSLPACPTERSVCIIAREPGRTSRRARPNPSWMLWACWSYGNAVGELVVFTRLRRYVLLGRYKWFAVWMGFSAIRDGQILISNIAHTRTALSGRSGKDRTVLLALKSWWSLRSMT